MRGVIAAVIVARPDDLIGQQLDIRKCPGSGAGIGDDLRAAGLQAVIIVDPAIVRVGVADIFKIALFPDPVSNAHDIVDDVLIAGLKAAHGLARPVIIGYAPFIAGKAIADTGAAEISIEGDAVIRGHVLPRQWPGDLFAVHACLNSNPFWGRGMVSTAHDIQHGPGVPDIMEGTI